MNKKEKNVLTKENKKEVVIDEKATVKPKMRQIIIETDGTLIHLVSADVAGKIELIAILQSLIGYLNNQKS